MLLDVGRLDEVLQAYGTAVEVEGMSRLYAAHVLADQRHIEAAIEWFKLAQAEDPLEAQVQLGAYFQELGRLDDALALLERARDLGAVDTYVYLSSVLRRLGRPADGREMLEQGVRLGVPDCQLQLGNELAREAAHPERVEDLYRAALAAGELHAHNNLAVHLFEHGGADRYDERRSARSTCGTDLSRQGARALVMDWWQAASDVCFVSMGVLWHVQARQLRARGQPVPTVGPSWVANGLRRGIPLYGLILIIRGLVL